jgi:hypothetical protein
MKDTGAGQGKEMLRRQGNKRAAADGSSHSEKEVLMAVMGCLKATRQQPDPIALSLQLYLALLPVETMHDAHPIFSPV